MEGQGNRLFYGWSVVLGCIVVHECNIGTLSNTTGVSLKPVFIELGVFRDQIALCSSIFSVIGMFSAPFQKRLTEKYSLKKLMVSDSVIAGICLFCYSFALGLWFFYTNTILCGLVFGFTNLTSVNEILSNWFTREKGTAVGVVLAGSGFMAMVVTPVLSHMTTDCGRRSRYRFIGSLCLLLMIPVILLVIKESLEDGKFGGGGTGDTETRDQNMKTGLTRAQTMSTRRLWLILAALVLASSMAMEVQQRMIAYLADMGYEQQYAPGVYSLSTEVLTAGKVILGTLYDRLRIKGASVHIYLALVTSLGFLLMADLSGIPYLFTTAFSLANAIQSISATCLMIRFFDTWGFTSIYRIRNTGNMTEIALGTSMSAWIYDAPGSYVATRCFCPLLSAVISILYTSTNREYEWHVLQKRRQ